MRTIYMYKGSLEATIAILKASDEKHWDMTLYIDIPDTIEWGSEVHVCNTAGCIAGHIWYATHGGLDGTFVNIPDLGSQLADKARDFLFPPFGPHAYTFDPNAIHPSEAADILFIPGAHDLITREMAVKVLEDVLDHGILSWTNIFLGEGLRGGLLTNASAYSYKVILV